MFTSHRGFSLIEVIVAVALFSIIAGGGLAGFIPVLNQNRQTAEILRANRLAEEGLEAVRSIRNRDFSLLTSGTKGIGVSSNLWSFSGSSDVTDKYTRQLTLTSAARDAGGTMVISGTTDPDTWLVSSKVIWNYSIGDTKQFILDTILTNWRKAIGGVNYDGFVVYGRGTSITPYFRSYTNSTNLFGSEIGTTLGGEPRSIIVRTSPQSTEAIVGAINNTGTLYVYCFDGNNWSLDWTASVGATAVTRAFDIQYETNTGDALVVYGTGTTTTNELNYKTKSAANACGSGSWSSTANFDPIRTSNKVQWVKLAQDRRTSSNLIALSWADFANDLSSAIWTGTAFGNEPSSASETNLEVGVTTTVNKQSVDSFDLEYESLSGDLMLVWGNNSGTNGTNGTRYRVCTGGISSCAWGTGGTIPSLLDDATNLDISANPYSDQIVFASIGNAGSDLQTAYWSGTAWTGRANLDTACAAPLAGTKLVATGWLTSVGTTRSVVVYNDSNATNIGWYLGDGGTFTLQTDWTPSPVFANPQKWYEIIVDPKNSDRLMFMVADNTYRLFAKRLVMTSTPAFTWTNADSSLNLGTTLSQNITSPYGFSYWY